MKYTVGIGPHKWILEAPSVEIAICAIYSGLQTNKRVDFYEGATEDELEKARFKNMYDLKTLTQRKIKEYAKFLEKNKDEIIVAIRTITDLEKEIIDKMETFIQEQLINENTDITEINKILEGLLQRIKILKTNQDTNEKD